LLDADGHVADLNDLAYAMFRAAPGDLRGSKAARLLGDVSLLRQWLTSDDHPLVFGQRLEARRSNDVPITVDLSARRCDRDGARQALCLLYELGDDRLRAEAQLYFDVAFETAPIGMALFNTDGQYIRVNSALCDLLGRDAEALLGRRDQEFTHPDDRKADIEAAWRVLRGEMDTFQCEKRFLRPDGAQVWAIANLSFLRTPEGHPLSWVGQFQDVTERKNREARLQELADRDPLTGVYNRRCLEQKLEQMIERGRAGIVLVVDLDRFKEINDSYGHRAGDLVLIGMSSALRENLRSDDIIARIGGDEFALVLADAGEQEARDLVTLISEVVEAQRFAFDSSVSVSASVGMTRFGPGRPAGADIALERADSAMYRAKTGGRGRWGDATPTAAVS